jgi:DNA-binding MarR family transcriptional regulator
MSEFQLDRFLPFRLNRAAEFVGLGFSGHYRKAYRMTRPEWRVLAALGAYGRMTATAVGRNSTMHKTKVSRAVRALEGRRWLKRFEDEADRRVEHLELTREGRRAYDKIAREALAYEQKLAEWLGAEGIRALEAGLAAVERQYGVEGA